MTSEPVSRTVCVIFVVLTVLFAAAPAAAQCCGITAGANFSSMDGIDARSSSATLENSTGYHVGAFFELGGGPLRLRPGLVYQQLGTVVGPTGSDLDLSAIEVPVDVRFRFFPLPLVSPYLLGGPVLTFGRSGEVDDAVEDVSLTADLGAGVEVTLPGAGIRVMPELRWSIGVTNYLSDSFELGGTTVRPGTDGQRLSKIMLRLNVLF